MIVICRWLRVVATNNFRLLQLRVNVVFTIYFMGAGSRSIASVVSGCSPHMVLSWASADAAVVRDQDVKTVGVAVVVVGESLFCVGLWSPLIVILIHILLAVVIVVSKSVAVLLFLVVSSASIVLDVLPIVGFGWAII